MVDQQRIEPGEYASRVLAVPQGSVYFNGCGCLSSGGWFTLTNRSSATALPRTARFFDYSPLQKSRTLLKDSRFAVTGRYHSD